MFKDDEILLLFATMLRAKGEFTKASTFYSSLTTILLQRENEDNRDLLLTNIILLLKSNDRRLLMDSLVSMKNFFDKVSDESDINPIPDG